MVVNKLLGPVMTPKKCLSSNWPLEESSDRAGQA